MTIYQISKSRKPKFRNQTWAESTKCVSIEGLIKAPSRPIWIQQTLVLIKIHKATVERYPAVLVFSFHRFAYDLLWFLLMLEAKVKFCRNFIQHNAESVSLCWWCSMEGLIWLVWHNVHDIVGLMGKHCIWLEITSQLSYLHKIRL